jgi:hypothetical protein
MCSNILMWWISWFLHIRCRLLAKQPWNLYILVMIFSVYNSCICYFQALAMRTTSVEMDASNLCWCILPTVWANKVIHLPPEKPFTKIFHPRYHPFSIYIWCIGFIGRYTDTWCCNHVLYINNSLIFHSTRTRQPCQGVAGEVSFGYAPTEGLGMPIHIHFNQRSFLEMPQFRINWRNEKGNL